jgi:hypothetical protein
MPIASLAEALRPLLRNAPQALLDRLPKTALAQLGELIPALRQRMPHLPELALLPADQNALLAVTYAVSILGDAQHWYEATYAAAQRLGDQAPTDIAQRLSALVASRHPNQS